MAIMATPITPSSDDGPPSTFFFCSLNLSNSDILTVYDGDDLSAHILGQYLGSIGPQKLYSSTPDVTIQFHSDPAGLIFGKGQGFVMNYVGGWHGKSRGWVSE